MALVAELKGAIKSLGLPQSELAAQWLDDVDVDDELLAATSHYAPETPPDTLLCLFDWSKAPHGQAFWVDIHARLTARQLRLDEANIYG